MFVVMNKGSIVLGTLILSLIFLQLSFAFDAKQHESIQSRDSKSIKPFLPQDPEREPYYTDGPGSKELCPTGEQKIPKKIHQIWINFGKGEEVFEKYHNYTKRIIDLHPGWEYKLWKEAEIVALIKEHYPFFLNTFLKFNAPIKKHDAARYVILNVFGGVYLDHDSIIFRNLEPFLGTCSFVSGYEYYKLRTYTYANNFLASVPKNPFFDVIVNRMIIDRYRYVIRATGPTQLQNSLQIYLSQHPSEAENFKLYHHTFLFPINPFKLPYFDIDELMEHYPNAFGLLFYDTSWARK